jgi:hypothetical protein
MPVFATLLFIAVMTARSDSSTVSQISVTWQATDGTITRSGLYSANRPGRHLVIARAGKLADTAAVTVTAMASQDFGLDAFARDCGLIDLLLGDGRCRRMLGASDSAATAVPAAAAAQSRIGFDPSLLRLSPAVLVVNALLLLLASAWLSLRKRDTAVAGQRR